MINNFEYFAPETIDEAMALVSKYQDDCKIIAGGQSLLVLMRMGLVAPAILIDIKRLKELDYIKVEKKKRLQIGALTTHRTLETSEMPGEKLAVMAEMVHGIASAETRNWGTIGGNIAHADPAGDVLPVLIALGATIAIISPKGEKVVDAEVFPRDYLETVLGHDEILKEVIIPIPDGRTGVAYEKFKMVEEDYATISAAVSIRLNRKRDLCKDIRVVLGAVGPTALRAQSAEEHLKGKELTEDLLLEAGEVASKEIDPVQDMHSSEEYKKELVKVYVKRVGKKALERAKKQ